ncbi:DUF1837 domain-containing protein [Maridesulfovibrio sp.]|uniref:HamA C-terminal domain-containing protein n=1 Tax=Maridesulfovibrio sp. TaxID=2795000 RepID=UPI002A18A781|nr:DUF1837 domain-containing protein [Maridesulfovibrio sp.]
MALDWGELLTVENKDVESVFVNHEIHPVNNKLHCRGYTLPFTGTQQRTKKLMKLLSQQLEHYVFPEAEKDDYDWPDARDKFGDNDPESDGKLGEMLLYIMVEAFLQTPMIAYKLKDLSNPNDQVKGADGVFVGEYSGRKALLIGESKIHNSLTGAISSAIESLHRFHESEKAYDHEICICRKYPKERELSAELLQEALDILNDEVERIIVHPVFISYDYDSILKISTDAEDAKSAEFLLKDQIKKEVKRWQKLILKKKDKFPSAFKVYLDFFFLPVEDCLKLRNDFYRKLHGCEYKPPLKSKKR